MSFQLFDGLLESLCVDACGAFGDGLDNGVGWWFSTAALSFGSGAFYFWVVGVEDPFLVDAVEPVVEVVDNAGEVFFGVGPLVEAVDEGCEVAVPEGGFGFAVVEAIAAAEGDECLSVDSRVYEGCCPTVKEPSDLRSPATSPSRMSTGLTTREGLVRRNSATSLRASPSKSVSAAS